MLYTPEASTSGAGFVTPARLPASPAGHADEAGTTFSALVVLNAVPESWRRQDVVNVQTKSASSGPSTANAPIVYDGTLAARPQQIA
jgi:hypothetical protein